MKIIWTQTALDKLKSFHDYIKKDNPRNAQKWAEKLIIQVESLTALPNRGRKIPELEFENIQELILGNYGIVYKIEKDAILILLLRHFKQKLPIPDLEA